MGKATDAMYRTSSMLFIASLRCHVRVPACAMRRLGQPGQQRRKEAKKPSRIVAILVFKISDRSVVL